MSHPYPPHHPALPYRGPHAYFLTFCTHHRSAVFTSPAPVTLVLQHFLRAAASTAVVITAYCVMPDHVHLLVRGQTRTSDCRGFIKAAKQYSAYYYARRYQQRLWQRYGFERVMRDEHEETAVLRYLLDNPVRAGLVSDFREYPYLGSQIHTLDELVKLCE